MSLLSLIIKIGADASEAEAKLGKVENLVSGLGKKIAGAFSAGAVISFIKHTAEAAHETANLADQMNVTLEQFVRMQSASVKVGIEVEKFGQFIAKVSDLRAKAGSGDKRAIELMDAFGVSLKNVNERGRDTFGIIELIKSKMDELGKLSPDMEAKWIEAFGAKSGMKMLPALARMKGSDFASAVKADRTAAYAALGEDINALGRGTSGFLKNIGDMLIASPYRFAKELITGKPSRKWGYESPVGDAARGEAADKPMFTDEEQQRQDAKEHEQQFRQDAENSRNREKQAKDWEERKFQMALENALTPGAKIKMLRDRKSKIWNERRAGLTGDFEDEAFGDEAVDSALHQMFAIDNQIAGLRRKSAGSLRRGPVSSLAATGNMIFGGATRDPIPVLEKIETNTRKGIGPNANRSMDIPP